MGEGILPPPTLESPATWQVWDCFFIYFPDKTKLQNVYMKEIKEL